jgi:hypothetical protein
VPFFVVIKNDPDWWRGWSALRLLMGTSVRAEIVDLPAKGFRLLDLALRPDPN